MFLRRDEAILPTHGGIDGLCASLNRPVVDIEGLPPGPARAVIALHRSATGARCLAVAVRSEDSGSVLLYAFRGELAGAVDRVMDTGLQFAESMGFLFDEDVRIGDSPGSERRALEMWSELTGDELHASPDADPLDDELLLLEEEGDDLDLELGDELEIGAPAAEGQVLSKFRQPEPPNPAEQSDDGSAQLGRIAIVKRRQDAAEPPEEAPPLLTRLLARL